MNEQAELMRSAAREFAEKYLKDVATKIEREGIGSDIKEKILQQGFLGATLSPDMGGAGLDPLSQRLMLFEFAKVSPSVSAYIFFHNDIVSKVLETRSDKESIRNLLEGKDNYGIYWPGLMEGAKTNSSEKVMERVINSSCNKTIGLFSDGKVYLVEGKNEPVKDFKPLGLRGMGICNFFPEKRVEYGKKEVLEDLLIKSSGDIASIFLGIAEGSLEKTMEYTRVRKTFNEPLKNYEPVAFKMAELESELEIMKYSLFSDEADEVRLLMLKNMSASFSKKATKYALQFHGGYGYLEDFGVEKFYRDSVALSAIIYRPVEDKRFLASKIYGDRSGFL